MKKFFINRVIEPASSLPVSAWKLDSNKDITENEMLIKVHSIKIEDASFHQICNAARYDKERIKEDILNIIKTRGKLHNPYTDSGGMLFGTVEKIGSKYQKRSKFSEGDRVFCISSLAGIPLDIDEISGVDFFYGQIEVSGHAILFGANPVAEANEKDPKKYVLSILDEGGSISKVPKLSKKTKGAAIIATSILQVISYAAAIRSDDKNKKVIAIIDNKHAQNFSSAELKWITDGFVDNIYSMDIQNTLGCYNELRDKENSFDFIVNCANEPGAEALSVLIAKENATLFLVNLINDAKQASLTACSMGKNINIMTLVEYVDNYVTFTYKLIKQNETAFDKIDLLYKKHEIDKKTFDESMSPGDEDIHPKITEGSSMDMIFSNASNLAKQEGNILIEGEPGCGKEMLVRTIHTNSFRRYSSYIKVNCNNISDRNFESAMYGVESQKDENTSEVISHGYLERANNGTLYLENVDELSNSSQLKLAETLRNKKFARLKSKKKRDLNVRVVASTSLSLKHQVDTGRFREDLYYILNSATIEIPPLRDRPEDLKRLINENIAIFNKKYNRNKRLTPNAMKEMLLYDWPNNAEEVKSLVEMLVSNIRQDEIHRKEVKNLLYKGKRSGFTFGSLQSAKKGATFTANIEDLEGTALSDKVAQYEKEIIQWALINEGSTRKAAKKLGISQSKMMRKKKAYGL